MRIADLTLLRPEFRSKLELLLDDCAEHLPTLKVFESVRSPERQAELYARGRDPKASDFGRTVTKAGPWQSAHQFGMGVDLVFCPNGQWSWDGDWALLRQLANQRGLQQLSFEQPHIQLPTFDWRVLARGPDDTDGWLAWLARTLP